MTETNKPKSVVYFPSLSAGSYRTKIGTAGHEIAPGVPYRFWDMKSPEGWRHPYFLITAGHLYKKDNIRTDWNLEAPNCLVFADSGGYQIATGTLKWDLSLREKIFHWLENNSDIACNLDFPTNGAYAGKFQQALTESIDNFKYFEKHQSGKTKFLNVLQGNNAWEQRTWYNAVKDFNFNGWCIGGGRRLVNFMHSIALFCEQKEWDNKDFTWLHLLGISKVSDFLVLAQLQKLLNIYTDNRITVSTDSSTPGQYPIFGNMVYNVNWKDQVYNMLKFPQKPDVDYYPTSGNIPSAINHPAINSMSWDILTPYSTNATIILTYHNLWMFIRTVEDAEKLVSCPLEILSLVLPNNIIQVLKSMEEMFASTNPLQVYERYRIIYEDFGGDVITSVDKEAQSEFFDFPEPVKKKRVKKS